MLKKNTIAPMFRALDENGHLLSLMDYVGEKNVVLYFYPKDDTPGCTIEANQFTQLIEEFSALDTVIIGVSKDSCESHAAFVNKYDLKVRLLADTTGEICVNYDVWREREKEGVKSMAILRSTFVIDKQGILAEVLYGVTPEGHAQAMLDTIKKLGQPDTETESDPADADSTD